SLLVFLPIVVVPIVVAVLAACVIERRRAKVYDLQQCIALGAIDQVPHLDRVAQVYPRATRRAAGTQLALGTPLALGFIEEDIVVHCWHLTTVSRLRTSQ